jgi:hypothetical protein
MPNWCSNGITLRHADPTMIDRVIKGKEGLLMEFLPTPQDLVDTVSGFVGEDKQAAHEAQMDRNVALYGYKDWYDWNINNWGTKWDFALENVERVDANTVSAAFESAWAPPTGAYEKLMELGFEIKAYYYEPGMCFAGIWEDGIDSYYEYSDMNSAEVAECFPKELDEMFCISESMAEYEEENQEIDLDGGLSAVNEQEQQK